MPDDIATLALEIESKGVTEAVKALDGFIASSETATESAAKLEGGVGNFSSASEKLAQRLREAGVDLSQVSNFGDKAGRSFYKAGEAAVTMSNDTVVAMNKVGAAVGSASAKVQSLASRLESAQTGFAKFQTQPGSSGAGFGGGGGDEEGPGGTLPGGEPGGLKKFDEEVKKSVRGMSIWRAAFYAYLIKSFAEGVINATEAGEKFREFSQAAGLSTDSYQKLGFAALQAGVDQTKFNTAMDFFEKSIGNAERGNKALQRSFADVGVSVHDLFSLSPEQVFDKVAAGIQKTGSAAEQE